MAKATRYLSEQQQRVSRYRRAASLYQHEIVLRMSRPLGRPDLLDDLGRPKTERGFREHPLILEHYPLDVEIRYSGDSTPKELPRTTQLPSLDRMVYEFSTTRFHRACVGCKAFEPDPHARGFAAVFPYNGADEWCPGAMEDRERDV